MEPRYGYVLVPKPSGTAIGPFSEVTLLNEYALSGGIDRSGFTILVVERPGYPDGVPHGAEAAQ